MCVPCSLNFRMGVLQGCTGHLWYWAFSQGPMSMWVGKIHEGPPPPAKITSGPQYHKWDSGWVNGLCDQEGASSNPSADSDILLLLCFPGRTRRSLSGVKGPPRRDHQAPWGAPRCLRCPRAPPPSSTGAVKQHHLVANRCSYGSCPCYTDSTRHLVTGKLLLHHCHAQGWRTHTEVSSVQPAAL